MRKKAELLEDILENPRMIFYEVGGDVSAVNYYDSLREKGYEKGLLDFLSKVVREYFKEHEIEEFMNLPADFFDL